MKRCLATLICTWGLLVGYAVAGTPSELYAVKSLKCEFPIVSTSDWQKDKPNPQLKKQEFGFHIDGINLQQGKARIIGNAGSTDLSVVNGGMVVHFIEYTPSGNMNVTSVFAATTKLGFKAVHSRHLYMMSSPLPSQSYGYCQRWE